MPITEQKTGAYFRRPIESLEIVSYIINHIDKCVLPRDINLKLEGASDSRIGGHKQFVFTSYKNFTDSEILSESLVLIDREPDKSLDSSNQFCIVTDPRAVFIDVLIWLLENVGFDAHWRDFTKQAIVSNEAQIAPSAIIETGVQIGAGCSIGAGAVIKKGTIVGENTIIRENVVIGCDGLTAYKSVDGRLLKFPHIGGVSIGINSEIGANSVVAGGILSPTIIGNNAILGNLCNVGHGVIIEDNVWMSVGSLIGGHTTVRSGATIAMGVSVRDNLVIGKQTSTGMGSVIVKDVNAGHSVFGNPAKRMVGLKTGPKR